MWQRLGILLVLGWQLFAMGVHAQENLRIGYVDMKRVLDNAPQVVASREQLEREFRPRNDDILDEEARLNTRQQQLLDDGMDPAERIELEREVRNMQRTIERRKEDLRDELAFRRNEEIQRLEDELTVAVQSIAREQGYDLVIASPVVYANPTLDITELILSRLSDEFTADQNEALSSAQP